MENYLKQEVQKDLLNLADEKYNEFQSGLCPGIDNIIGVRLPVLRNYAKELSNKIDIKEYLEIEVMDYYEEIMLQGMLIGLLKENFNTIKKYIVEFVPKINNWAVCDSFCAGLKITKKNKEEMWQFIQPYLKSDKEFEIRFGVVMLLDYYIVEDKIEQVLSILNEIHHEGYYVKMAVAWAISKCYIKFPTETMKLIKENNLDDYTHNKAIQKVKESYCVTKAEKEQLEKLKRKKKQ
ncbi:MAG: DNA alkylation repair protein [Clostridia bacterium]